MSEEKIQNEDDKDENSQDENSQDETSAPLLDHLIELRSRLIRSFIYIIIIFSVCLFFADEIYNFLAQPFVDVALEHGKSPTMIFTGLQDKFFVNIKISFYLALCISFPLVANQIWKFIAPGLYRNEKKAFLPFLLGTPILFIMGASVAYYLVIPNAWGFFMSYEVGTGEVLADALGSSDQLKIQSLPAVKEYLSLTILLMFAFAVTFQLPVLLLLLARVGIVTADGLAAKRRYMIVGAFAFAAVMTPPDLFSQVGLGVSTLLLYELSIIAIRIMIRKKEDV